MPSSFQALTPAPYAVSVFTDTERRKSFVTLFFRHEKASREAALAFPGVVLDALTEAGLTSTVNLDIHLTPLPQAGRFRCHVQVAVQAASGSDLLVWADALSGKAVNG